MVCTLDDVRHESIGVLGWNLSSGIAITKYAELCHSSEGARWDYGCAKEWAGFLQSLPHDFPTGHNTMQFIHKHTMFPGPKESLTFMWLPTTTSSRLILTASASPWVGIAALIWHVHRLSFSYVIVGEASVWASY